MIGTKTVELHHELLKQSPEYKHLSRNFKKYEKSGLQSGLFQTCNARVRLTKVLIFEELDVVHQSKNVTEKCREN